ncbi:MAG: 2-dehydropantoate 2-reductase [Clostridiales bacterium]|nr:2-dehydropantoate 2-reductase [Clostridiales bacterium]
MKYLIIGSGGTGGCIGAYMTRAKADVAMIARGCHLEAIRRNGLFMETTAFGQFTVYPKISAAEEYSESPDIIFVCVKGYSLDGVIPFIKRIAGKDTIVIPVLNIYTVGEYLQEKLPEITVADGCIYVAANITDYGKIKMHGDIFRIIFGIRGREATAAEKIRLQQTAADLNSSGIMGIVSENIRRDALLKFSYVSAQAACGAYYGVTAGAMQKDGEARNCFIELVREIDTLAKAMGVDFGEDIVKRNLKILADLLPSSSTSMQRDIEAGKQSEIDGLIYSVADNGAKLGIELPMYEKITRELRSKLKNKY